MAVWSERSAAKGGGDLTPQARDDDDPGLGLGMELALCVHGLPPTDVSVDDLACNGYNGMWR